MAKQLNVSLAFTANTNEAIAQIKKLQQELNHIATGNFGPNSAIKALTPEIQQAMKAASQLQASLEGAVNVKTGKLDLGKFSESLQKNKLNLNQYAQQLSALGPIGNKAFLQLAQSISQAEMPLRRSSTLVKELGTTLANTARWQLSSSILHGFMGAVQSAYGYAQDLNESLNNIRIVTGQNTSQMAKFAKEANKAAKALSSTTTEYTNASLIYYQQGLTDQQVKERTDITIKMANVSRQSAEIVSDQLTAVWNNFYDGTKSLEHYADVMTALGAATASSTDEISEGLNKFAAVADTVGLSYEYAASALATVTATTRQSADVVGTAFKTLFARLQDLELGETLDDGTDLGKYSAALNAVGINIKDVNGDMKSMDNILDELGGKWQSLSKDTQVALAQTVAGTRQYTQLVALMDNWDYFQKNLGVANSSKGALQSQADIYAESWEAASKKVTTALQRIYEELLNDEFFIDLANFTADLLDTIGNIIDAFGGVKGVLLIIGNLVTKIFHDEMAKGLNNLAYNIKRLTPSGRQAEQKTKDEAWAAAARLQSNSTGNVRQAEEAALSQEVGLQRKLMENASRLSEEELKQYQIRMDGVRVLQSQAAEQAKIADEKQAELDALKEEMRIRAKFQASASTRKKETAKVMSSIDSDRAEVEAKNQKEIEEARRAKFNAVRLAAEDRVRNDPNISNKEKIGTEFAARLQQAGDEAVAAAAQGINEELQQMAEEQAAAYEAILAQRLQDARADIEKKAAEAAATVGESVDSHTETMEDLGATKGLSKKLSSATNQSAVKKMGEKDAVAAAKVALKDISQLKAQIDKLSKKGIDLISAEELKQLSVYEEKLTELLKASKIDVKELKENLANLASDASTISFALDSEIQTSAKDASANAGVDKAPEEYIAVANAAEAAAFSQNAYNRTAEAGSDVVDELGNDIDGAGTRMLGLADKITYGSQAVMSFGMVLSSTQGLIDTLFNPDMSGWEKFIAILTTIGTLVPMVMSGYDAYTKIFQKNTVAAAANAIAQGGSAVATETLGAAVDKQTPKVAKSAMTWWGHPVVAIIAGAVLAVVAAFAIFDNILESNIKKTAESAERAQEHADAVKKEADAHNDLIASYKSALKDFEETGQNKEALIDISLNVAEAYGIEGAAVDALSGNYKNLTKKIIEARKAELEKQKTAQKGAITTTSNAMLQSMRAGDGALKASGTYTGLFDNGASNDDEQVAYKALGMGDYEFLKKEGGEIRFTVANSSDPYEMYNYYLELQSLVQNMQQLAAEDDSINLGASEIYQDIMAELQEGKDHFTKLQTYIQEFQNSGGELAAYSTTLSDGQGIFDIDTLEEYEEFEKKYLEYYKNLLKGENIEEGSSQWKTMIEYAETYLSTFEGIGELKARQQAFDELTNETNAEEMEKIKNYYQSLSGDQQTLFWTLDIDEDSTLEEVQNALKAAQAYLDQNSLVGTLQITDSLVEKLSKDKKDAADWGEISTEYAKFKKKNPDALDWTSFMQLSQKEQIEYIENYGKVTQQMLQGVTTDSIEYATEQLVTAQEELQDAQENLDVATANAAEATKKVEAEVDNLTDKFTTEFTNVVGAGYTDPRTGKTSYTANMYTAFGGDDQWSSYFDWNKFKDTLTGFSFVNDDVKQIVGLLFDEQSKLYDADGTIAEGYNEASSEIISLSNTLANLMGYDPRTNPNEYADFVNGIQNIFMQNVGTGLFQMDSGLYGNDYSALMAGFEKLYNDKKTKIEAEDDDEQAAYEKAEEEKNKAATAVTNAESKAVTARQNEQYRMDALEADIKAAGLNVDDAEAMAEAIQGMALESKELADSLATDEYAAKRVAKEMLQFNKAVTTIASNYSKWNRILSEGSTYDQLSIVKELRTTYGDLLAMDGDALSQTFILDKKNLELMTKAANGSKEAYNQLQIAAAENIYASKVGEVTKEIKAAFNEIANIDTIEVGEKIVVGENNIATQLNTLYNNAMVAALQGGKDVSGAMQQANALMEAIGFKPPTIEWETKEVYISNSVPPDLIPKAGDSITTQQLTAAGVEWSLEPNETYTQKISMLVPKNTTFEKSVENIGGDKIGTKATKVSKVRKSDVVDRYREINAKIDDSTRAMDKASEAADRLWGQDRLDALRDVNNELENQIDLLETKIDEAEVNLQIDKEDLINTLRKEAKFNVTDDMFDENGRFLGGTAVLEKLYNQRKQYNNTYNTEAAEKVDKKIEAVKAILDLYNDTYEILNDTKQQRIQAIYQQQDRNYEIIASKLELEIEFNQESLDQLDRELEKMSKYINKYASKVIDPTTGKFTDMTEALAFYQKMQDEYTDNLVHYEDALVGLVTEYYGEEAGRKLQGQLNDAKDNGTAVETLRNAIQGYAEDVSRGDISQADFKAGLDEIYDSLINNIESLEQQKEALQDYYGNVLSLAIEEIQMYTSEMENLNSVLDHYSNILELVGKQEDRAAKRSVLRTRAQNLSNLYDVQKKVYEESSADAEKWYTEMQKALNDPNQGRGSNAYETYKKNWEAARDTANEAQDQMLAHTEEWAETMKSIIESELEDIASTFEESLTGGVSFDELLTSMERRSSLQEEYLTSTNKIYETNKLMRQAQQEIDKTTNTVAKRRLQSFINETNEMQNQNKLSQYELDIQQAKYDLLLAEIALEEAQNAKSTVRLQRDAEGNFGYVYTADANQVADAEQKLADAQNKLYNIGLDGANDYAQKYTETLQESQDAITELTQMWMNGEIASEEEFNRRKQEIVEFYGKKLQQYSELHTIALSIDSRIAGEAWSSEFMGVTASVEKWQGSVDGYFASAATQMSNWGDVCSQALEKSNLDDLDTTLGEAAAKSSALYTALMGDGKENAGVVKALTDYVSAAESAAGKNLELQGSIDTLALSYGNLLTTVTAARKEIEKVTSPKLENDAENGGDTELTKDRVYEAYTKIWSGNWGNGLAHRIDKGAEDPGKYTEAEVRAAQNLINILVKTRNRKWSKNDIGSATWQQIGVTGLATGGYTGDWEGAYGKLAFLHQKELVLNASDTENFLASMEVLERILRVIDLHSANSQIGGLLSSPVYRGHNNESVVQQDVRIEASFPGVTDRNEIEEAFNNLVNRASQFANRK